MELSFDTFQKEFKLILRNELKYTVTLGNDTFGNIQRIDHVLQSLPERMESCKQTLENAKQQLANAKEEVRKPFSQEEELQTKSARLAELNALLDLDKTENAIVDGDIAEPGEKKEREIEAR